MNTQYELSETSGYKPTEGQRLEIWAGPSGLLPHCCDWGRSSHAPCCLISSLFLCVWQQGHWNSSRSALIAQHAIYNWHCFSFRLGSSASLPRPRSSGQDTAAVRAWVHLTGEGSGQMLPWERRNAPPLCSTAGVRGHSYHASCGAASAPGFQNSGAFSQQNVRLYLSITSPKPVFEVSVQETFACAVNEFSNLDTSLILDFFLSKRSGAGHKPPLPTLDSDIECLYKVTRTLWAGNSSRWD